MKVVPEKATEAMIDATFRKDSELKYCKYERKRRANIYEKMVKSFNAVKIRTGKG